MRRASTLLILILVTSWSLAQTQSRYFLTVKGLTCPFCAYGLEKKLKKVKGVESVSIQLEKDLAVVTAKPGVELGEEPLRKAVRGAGFSLQSLKKVEEEPGPPKDAVKK